MYSFIVGMDKQAVTAILKKIITIIIKMSSILIYENQHSRVNFPNTSTVCVREKSEKRGRGFTWT